jgi:hypothetical protein
LISDFEQQQSQIPAVRKKSGRKKQRLQQGIPKQFKMSAFNSDDSKINLMIVTDIGCDADDILATIQIINTLRHLRKAARIAFVLTMLNPPEKAIFLKHLLSLVNMKDLELEVEIYLAKGYLTLEQATEVHPNFPPRFGPVYDQIQGIDAELVDKTNIFPIEQLSQFTDRCSDHSIHLLVLSPISMTECIDFNKINHETVHMMGGVAERNGVTKIGYNCGVNPGGFVDLCHKTNGKLVLVTTATCDATRIAVDFAKVKNSIDLDGIGGFIFDRMMSWHHYITKAQTNFLNVNTPCISDLVAADVFLRAIFPHEYVSAMTEMIQNAVDNRLSEGETIPVLSVNVEMKVSGMSINLDYKKSYLDDTLGELFNAKENGTKIEFLEAVLHFDTVSHKDYATFLVASVFTH